MRNGSCFYYLYTLLAIRKFKVLIMKRYRIHYFNPDEQKVSDDWTAEILKANSPIDALRQWHIHMNANCSIWERKQTWEAICVL